MGLFSLDDSQKIAVYFPVEKSVIVEAPPGHGKTFVMARRIEYILQTGFIHPPQKILGLTFTNAAAGEMLEDIRKYLRVESQELVQVMTFHSLCYKILRAYGNVIGIDRNFSIIGELEKSRLLKNLILGVSKKSADDPISKKILTNYYGWFTEKYLKSNDTYISSYFHEEVTKLNDLYLQSLRPNQIDYNQLLIYTIRLFEQYPNILNFYRTVFRYFLVDEFQDTNRLQFKLLQILLKGISEQPTKLPPTPVYILADREQAIFRFQGADPENIDVASIAFECPPPLLLDNNYRCSSSKIRAFTNSLRGNLVKDDERIEFILSSTPGEQADNILEKIKNYIGPKHDICIIAQNQWLLEETQNSLTTNNIPYVFVPDFKAKSIETKYENIFRAIADLSTVYNSNAKLTSQIRNIFDGDNFDWKNDEVLCTLLDLASKFEQSMPKAQLWEKALLFHNDVFIEIHWGKLLRKRVHDKVFVSTIHGVKGLQFAQVHLCGLTNYGHIHNSTCTPCNFGKNIHLAKDQLEEGRKTLYVGASRAQDELYLYATKSFSGRQRLPMCILAKYESCLDNKSRIKFCGH